MVDYKKWDHIEVLIQFILSSWKNLLLSKCTSLSLNFKFIIYNFFLWFYYETHPNIDTPSLFKWRHEARVQKMEDLQSKKDQLQKSIDA